MKIRVLLVDDHQLFREGLARLLADEPDIEVAGQAGDGRSALDMVVQLSPTLVILDLSMPGLNGTDTARALARLPGAPRILVLSMHADRRFVVEALRAGVAGFVLKGAAFDELMRAVRTVHAGGVHLSPAVAGLIAEDYRAGMDPGPVSALAALSVREREVLQLLVEGQTVKQIAATLHIHAKTVDSHRRRMMQRLQIDTVPDLVKLALREGLTELQ